MFKFWKKRSGHSKQEAGQRFVSKGLAGLLQKPFAMGGLKQALMGQLDRD